VNTPLYRLLSSVVSMRRSAIELGVHRTTVARKLKFLAGQGRLELNHFLCSRTEERGAFRDLQFDEMETFEHTKCKPISIPLMVESGSRLIIGVRACSMPAKGLLVHKARKRYGKRPNHRPKMIRALFSELGPFISERARITSDSHPSYPRLVRESFPHATHRQEMGRKSSLGGQGELKRIKWDPLFSLNHTAAMYRANVSRLIRRTWCTTKKLSALEDHLVLYAVRHNQTILQREKKRMQESALESVAA
jgi:hypothetical protein